MSPSFTDQRQRMRRILESALAGASFESSREEDQGRSVVVVMRRGGRPVSLRFRGVSRSVSDATPAPGAMMSLQGVSGGVPGEPSKIAAVFFPLRLFAFLRARSWQATRVRIDAGGARLDITCEDAEWWEDGPAGPIGRSP